MSLRKTYAVDSKKATEGVPFELGTNEDGTKPTLYIARSGQQNQRYRKALEAAYKPYKFQAEHGTLDNDVAIGVLRKVFSQTCVTGWTNVLKSDVTGVATDEGFIDFSPENAEKLFADLPDLFDEVNEFAGNIENFRANDLVESAKN